MFLCSQFIYFVESRAQETEKYTTKDQHVDDAQQVEITSLKDPDWKPYRTMLKGLDAFKAKHELAPNADLRFVLIPQNHATTNFHDVKLRIAGNETSIPIAISDNGTFVLTRDEKALDENADIILNQKKSLWKWRPYIRSPGLLPNQRRLGDLRLECEVRWAVEYDDIAFLKRNFFRLAGGPCKASNIDVYFYEPRKIIAATILVGEKHQTIALEKEASYFIPPLYDDKLSDDTLIELQFVDDLNRAAIHN